MNKEWNAAIEAAAEKADTEKRHQFGEMLATQKLKNGTSIEFASARLLESQAATLAEAIRELRREG